MNKIKSILKLLLIILILPISVFAASDSSGEQGGSAAIINSCSPNCVGIQRSSSLAGVRITFVDESGNAIATSGGKSYDFVTYVKSGKESLKTMINGYTGDRNKVALSGGGNFSATNNVKQSDIPRFSAVIAAYNANIAQTGSPHISTLNTSGNTGGNLSGFEKELAFFLGLTESTNQYYVEDVNAFIKAIATVTGGYNATDLIYEIAQGCTSGDEIFIVMEPIFFWSGRVGNGYQNYFGTLADSYHFFNGEIIGSLYNTNNMAYLIYYQREIAAYHGVTGVEKNAFNIQSGADLLSTAGFGIAVDWANDPGQYCGSCTFVDGKFAYDNKLYPGDLTFSPEFTSIQHFAFAKRDEGGAGCCDILAGQLDSLPSEWQTAYNQYCLSDECCSPKVPTTPVTIDVNNCCTDSTHSEIVEVNLDDLFCYSNDLKVDYYFPKCDADYYINKEAKLNDYCEMYCTERVSVDVPGAITAQNGRYFELTKNIYGTTSPYIEGFKRCRIRVYYDKWLKKYVEKVQEEINYYNEYQLNKAKEKTYEKASQNVTDVSGTIDIKVTCSTTAQQPIAGCTGNNCTTTVTTCSDTVETTYNYSYKKYHFTTLYSHYPVRIKESSKNNYSAIEIEDDTKGTVSHAEYSTYNLSAEIEAANTALESAKSSCECSTIDTATRDKLPDEDNNYPNEDVPTVKADYAKKAVDAEKNYKAATGAAEQLEKDIHKCDNYFTEDDIGKNAELSYKMNPELAFSYSQIYLTELGEKKLDSIGIGFNKNCTYETILPENDNENELSSPNYSDIYSVSGNIQVMHDFANKNLSYVTGPNGFNSFLHEKYNADKKFTHDAKYHSVCKWEEEDKPVYTLVPSGEVKPTITEDNYTKHNKEYKVYLTTLDGTYETYWDLTGLGSKIGNSNTGKFDNYFLNAGKTCAAGNPEEKAMFTCKLHIEHQITFVGNCYGTFSTDTTTLVEDCDEVPEYSLYNFKVVDAKDFFPSGTTDESGNKYAYNWTDTEEGQKVMEEINKKAQEDKIFAPENISYSFDLSPSEMRHIKNYNVEKNSEGGYTDFNLHCECPEEIQEHSLENGVGCTKCKSYFLENLAKNKIYYNGANHTVDVWASNNNLETIRNTINKW